MLMLSRLMTLFCVAIFSGFVGLTVGVLVAPASGEDTQRQLSDFLERHADVVDKVQRGQQVVADAFEDVRTRVAP